MIVVGIMLLVVILLVSLKCVKKFGVLDEEIINFVILLGVIMYLCGFVLIEIFFVMVVFKILYGDVFFVGIIILFIVLLGIFVVGVLGVFGGIVFVLLGFIIFILGFDEIGIVLMIIIFVL